MATPIEIADLVYFVATKVRTSTAIVKKLVVDLPNIFVFLIFSL
jgi:hypothetical protein